MTQIPHTTRDMAAIAQRKSFIVPVISLMVDRASAKLATVKFASSGSVILKCLSNILVISVFAVSMTSVDATETPILERYLVPNSLCCADVIGIITIESAFPNH